MKKSSKGLLYIVFVFIGLAILLYPTISNRWNQYRSQRLLSSYKEKVEKTEDTKIKTILEEAKAYNKTLNEPSVPDAFSIREGIKDEVYEGLLNVNADGLMGYVDIPTIEAELPLYHYTVEEVLQKGVGHLHGSALPVGGVGTHSVVSAHRGLPSAKLFSDLNLLQEGDHFYYRILGQTFAYEVDQILTVKPEQVESLSAVIGKDYSTLVTCTPYGINTERLLVRGHRIDYQEQVYEEDRQNISTNTQHLKAEILSALAGLLVALLVLLIYRYKTKKTKKQLKKHAKKQPKKQTEDPLEEPAEE
ncbi:MAG: class C sortase [Eubacteriales bacterium]|nr:class C sortase [Eubacteriales bacterium]